jgi:hypothetical protein
MSTATTTRKRGVIERLTRSWLYIGLIGIGVVSFVRIVTDTNDLTGAGTFSPPHSAVCGPSARASSTSASRVR